MKMRVLETRKFVKFAESEEISDKLLLESVAEIEAGLTGSPLGSSVHKIRIRRDGQGRVIVFGQSLPTENKLELYLFKDMLRMNDPRLARRKLR